MPTIRMAKAKAQAKPKRAKPKKSAAKKSKGAAMAFTPHDPNKPKPKPRKLRQIPISAFVLKTNKAGAKFGGRGKTACTRGVGGFRGKGVHDTIKVTLAPWWNYDRFKRDGTLRFPDPPKEQYFHAPSSVRANRIGHGKFGLRRGSRMDLGIQRVVHLYLKHKCPLRIFYSKPTREQYYKNMGWTQVQNDDREELDSVAKAIIPEAQDLLCFLDKLKFKPLGTQVACVDFFTEVGTRADLWVEDEKSGQLRTIELKCGLKSDFKRHRGWSVESNSGRRVELFHKMAAPYESVDWSTHNEAYLQTMLTNYAMSRTVDEETRMRFGPPMLIRIDDTGVYGYDMPTELTSKFQDYLRSLIFRPPSQKLLDHKRKLEMREAETTRKANEKKARQEAKLAKQKS
jgi:hypothetical protein